MNLARLRAVVALVAVAATAVAVAVRLPSAVGNFDRGASYGAGQRAYGGALAAADGVLVDDHFVAYSLDLLPLNARYAFLGAPSLAVARHDYHMAAETYRALPALMLEVLLPRVPVATPTKGEYVLCYACDTSPYEGRTHWFWGDPYGRKIGLVER